jgi:hypothetical protein
MSDPTYRVVNRENGFVRTSALRLHWEVSGDPISDNYVPSETTAEELWGRWLDYEISNPADRWGVLEHLPNEWQRIHWFVDGQDAGLFEGAPHQEKRWPNEEDFLTHYHHPEHEETGRPVQWSRLPVMDKLWRIGRGDKGGFIQEATGWKPAPFQPFVNLRQLAALAGLYYPQWMPGES